MLSTFKSDHRLDDAGNPAGGLSQGTGFFIAWQNGPLGRDGDRIEPNGAFVETIIAAAKDRILFYQNGSNGRFACVENELAILSLNNALDVLDQRTQRREAAGVEGTHEGN